MKKLLFATLLLLAATTAFGQSQGSKTMEIRNLAVSKSIGQVQERFEGDSQRWVIQIQDVHAHFGAQENIAAIISQLSDVYHIKTVALEGGWSESSFPESWALPSDRDKNMLAQALMQDEYITGPAFAALFLKMPLNLVGIEDQELYESNREVYLKHISQREKTISQLNSVAQKLADQKTGVYNPEFQAFDRALVEFREGKSAEKFLPILLTKVSALKIDLSNFDQVQLFKQILDLEQSINKDRLQLESVRLMKTFKNARLSFEEIIKSGKLSDEKIAFYPETQKYSDLFKLQDKLSHRDLFVQIDDLILNVKEKLFKSEEEKTLDAQSERFLLAKKLILFQATPSDLKIYQEQEDDVLQEMQAEGLGEFLDLALSFYDIAKKRDAIFFQKITSEPNLEGDIAIVTGGFHTEGLSQRLRDAKISYLVITPEIGTEPPNETLYFKRLQDVVPTAQALSAIQNRFLTPWFDRGFVEGVKILHQSNNIMRGVQAAINFGPTARPSGTKTAPPGLPDFTSMAPEQRTGKVRELFKQVQEGKQPIVIVIKTSTLGQILKNDVGLTIWEKLIAPERSYTIVIIQDGEYLDQTIGTKAQIYREPGERTIEAVVNEKRFSFAKMKKMIAVIDPEYQSDQVIALPPHPVALMLARLMIEQGAQSGIPSEEFMTTLQEELKQIFLADGLLKRAA